MEQCREPGKNCRFFLPPSGWSRIYVRTPYAGFLDLKPAVFAIAFETDRLIYGIVLQHLARTSYEIINDWRL